MSQGKRILIVDDDERAVGMLAEVLTRDGFEVQGVESGERALVALDGRRFDAAILDWSMPGMDGREVCRRIRARADDRAHMGILMLTGERIEDKDEVDILGLGADDYMRKGRVSAEVLIMRLRTIIQRREAMASAMAKQPSSIFCLEVMPFIYPHPQSNNRIRRPRPRSCACGSACTRRPRPYDGPSGTGTLPRGAGRAPWRTRPAGRM